MAYTCKNYKTKKDLKTAVAAGDVQVFQPGPFGPAVRDGRAVIEGPHGYHKWYAAVPVKNGVIPKGSRVS